MFCPGYPPPYYCTLLQVSFIQSYIFSLAVFSRSHTVLVFIYSSSLGCTKCNVLISFYKSLLIFFCRFLTVHFSGLSCSALQFSTNFCEIFSFSCSFLQFSQYRYLTVHFQCSLLWCWSPALQQLEWFARLNVRYANFYFQPAFTLKSIDYVFDSCCKKKQVKHNG